MKVFYDDVIAHIILIKVSLSFKRHNIFKSFPNSNLDCNRHNQLVKQYWIENILQELNSSCLLTYSILSKIFFIRALLLEYCIYYFNVRSKFKCINFTFTFMHTFWWTSKPQKYPVLIRYFAYKVCSIGFMKFGNMKYNAIILKRLLEYVSLKWT